MKKESSKNPKPIGKLEKDVRKSCITWLKKQGWIVHTIWTGGIPTGTGRYATNPAKGHPDCIAFMVKNKEAIYFEWKRESGGKLSPEQIYWHENLRICGARVEVINSLKSLKEKMIKKEKYESV